MNIEETEISGVFIIQPKVFEDDRGFFMESFNSKVFEEKIGLKIKFVQDNQSKSSRGVLRGLHFQKNPHAQSKLVRTIKGELLDVAVDIRKGSPNFGKHISVILSEENKKQLFIPKGFAHGFIVLSETAEILYKTDEYYHPESDAGIIFNDPDLNINWECDQQEIILSEKDKVLPILKAVKNNFKI